MGVGYNHKWTYSHQLGDDSPAAPASRVICSGAIFGNGRALWYSLTRRIVNQTAKEELVPMHWQEALVAWWHAVQR